MLLFNLLTLINVISLNTACSSRKPINSWEFSASFALGMTFASTAVQTDEIETLLPALEVFSEHNIVNWNANFSKRVNYQPKLATSLHSLNIIKFREEVWMSRRTKKWLFMMFSIIGIGCLGLIYFGYYCPDTKAFCALRPLKMNQLPKYKYIDMIGKPLVQSQSIKKENSPSFEDVVSKDFLFDIEDHDVMVFLHIQKTGGTTFGRHLVKDLELMRECICHRKVKKRCTCLRPGPNSKETWLFSRYSTGWKCGLHADWTELTSCVDDVMDKIDDNSVKRRYFYITYLRQPVHRYLSEYRHVRRGATWKNARLYCQGHTASKEEVPPCYSGEDWSDVTLEDFVSCPSNLANNRQTRMLADLSLVNCYNTATMTPQERNTVMLASAKRNLHQMAFFGLTEFQEISQYVFEETFNLKFNVRFEQFNETIADTTQKKVDIQLMDKIKEANSLDIQLYEYAKELLLSRYKRLNSMDPHFLEHFKNMGHMHFSWDDVDKEN